MNLKEMSVCTNICEHEHSQSNIVESQPQIISPTLAFQKSLEGAALLIRPDVNHNVANVRKRCFIPQDSQTSTAKVLMIH